MTRTVLAAALAALMAACSPNSQEQTGGDATTSAPAPAPTAPVSTTASPQMTADFVKKMAMSDMFEVESGRLAAQRARNPDIKSFGTMMVADHTATSNTLKSVVGSDPTMALPAALDQAHQDKLTALRNASADRFDELYLDQQQEAHENALATLQSYAQNGDNERLRQFASETAPKVNQHLQMVRRMDEVDTDEKKS